MEVVTLSTAEWGFLVLLARVGLPFHSPDALDVQ